MEDWLKYWPVAVVIINGAFLGAVWALSKTFASKVELRTEADARGRLEHRVTVAEQRLDQLPDQGDLTDLRDALARVDKMVATVSTEVAGLREIIVRVERPLNLLVDRHMSGQK